MAIDFGKKIEWTSPKGEVLESEYIENDFMAKPDIEIVKDFWEYEEDNDFYGKVIALENRALGEIDGSVSLEWAKEFDKGKNLIQIACESYTYYELFKNIPTFEDSKNRSRDSFERTMSFLVDSWDRKEQEEKNDKVDTPSGIFVTK